jgi:hypothetical protein
MVKLMIPHESTLSLDVQSTQDYGIALQWTRDMTPHAPKIFVASPIPYDLRYHISQTFRASGSLYPLTAPELALPESHITFAKA